MKRTVCLPVVLLMLAASYLSISTALAGVPDIYEAPPGQGSGDNIYQGANKIASGDPLRQHTLHTQQDVDWFRFYAIPGDEPEPTTRGDNAQSRSGIYTITVTPGTSRRDREPWADINVVFEIYAADGETLLERVNDGFYRGDEEIDFKPTTEGYYYIKVYEFTDTEPASECRINMHYTIKIRENDAGVLPYVVRGKVTNALTGQNIPNANLTLHCANQTRQSLSLSGNYNYQFEAVTCVKGLFKMTVTASGYRPVSCYFPITQSIAETLDYKRDIKLLPNNAAMPANLVTYNNPAERLIPSKSVYYRGEPLKVTLPWFHGNGTGAVYQDQCVSYYFALGYPPNGQNWQVISQKNRIEPPNVIQSWAGLDIPSQDDSIVLDMNTATMPVGHYLLYLLRMPAYVDTSSSLPVDLGHLTHPYSFEIR